MNRIIPYLWRSPMKIARRQFLGSAATVAAVSIVPRHVLGGPKFVPPSEKVNIALVARADKDAPTSTSSSSIPMPRSWPWPIPPNVGPWRSSTTNTNGKRAASRSKPRLKNTTPRNPQLPLRGIRGFSRHVGKGKGHRRRAVCHARPLARLRSARAMRGGKHVYCEKPLTHNLWDAGEIARIHSGRPSAIAQPQLVQTVSGSPSIK